MKVWATLGFFDDRGDGCVVALDLVDGRVSTVIEHDPPADLRVPGKGFTALTWMGAAGDSDLLVCGACAIYRFGGRSGLVLKGTLRSPGFNDLHGVHVAGDRIHVTNTGLDAVETFDTDGRFLGSTGFEAGWLVGERLDGRTPSRNDWARLHAAGWSAEPAAFEPEIPEGAYYSVGGGNRSIAPETGSGQTRRSDSAPFSRRQQRDYVHPNHAVVVDGHLLVTSLVRQSVTDLTDWRVVAHFDSPPHDGVRDGDRLWFTRVDGFVEARAIGDLERVVERHDITALTGVSGWCRGILVTAEHLWVGFTAIRERPGHPWHRGAFEATRTAVVVLDRRTGKTLNVFDLGVPGRHSKVFGLVAAS